VPARELADDLDVIPVAVGNVSGVQAQIDILRVGIGQEALDPFLSIDVGVNVRVEDQIDAELLQHHPAKFVGAVDQIRPVLRVDVRTFGSGTGDGRQCGADPSSGDWPESAGCGTLALFRIAARLMDM
jgi:hypothetical protein